MQMPPADASGDSRFGVMTQFAQGWTTNWASVAAGKSITHVRDELYWNVVEAQKGLYVFPAAYDAYMAALKKAGISPLIELDFENDNYDGGMTPYTSTGIAAYAQYGVQVLKHYGTQIKDVEIWNEYNGSFCTGPATSDRSGTYARMLQAAYAQIKAVRPDVTVVGGSTIEVPLPYWEKLMQAGALSSMDALSIHPYRYNSPPEGIEEDVASLQTLIKKYNNGKTKPIWVTEVGWGIQDGSAPGEMVIDQTTQAKFLVRAYALLLSAGVQRVYWYLLRDYQDFTLGLTEADTTPKLSAYAMQTLINELSGAKFVRREKTDPNIYSMLFQHADGTQVRVLWALNPVAVNLSVGTATTMTSMTGASLGAPTSVTLTDQPVFVDGMLAGLPPVPLNADVYLTDANRGFTDTQGGNGWSFGSFIGATTAFQPMTTYTLTDWTAAWSNEYAYNDVTPADQHPSTTANLPVSAVRRWTSNFKGAVRVTGNFQCSVGGDGVGVRVLVNGQPLFRKLLGGTSPDISYNFDFVAPVQVGTTIDFAADPGPATDINFDATPMTATISKHSGSTGLQNLLPTAWVYDGTLAGAAGVPAITSGTVLADSSAGFSGMQGTNGWSYGDFAGGTTNWEALTGFDGSDWGSSYPYLSVSSTDQHPSTANGQPVAVVRRWTSNYAGNVHLVGQFQAGVQGDGVGVSIHVNGQPLFRQLIGGGATNQDSFDLIETVQVGSTIDFVVDPGPGTDINFDATTLSATISAE